MKKFLQVLGLIFAVLIVLGIAGLVLTVVKGTALNKEAQAYVDEVAPKILADLRKETLLAYASEEFKSTVKTEELDKIFAWFQKLGPFQECQGATGQVNMSLKTGAGKVITGQYAAQAQFEAGPAQVQFTVVKKGDAWFVQYFKISSLALAGE
jgi:phosphoserine aminotransferase